MTRWLFCFLIALSVVAPNAQAADPITGPALVIDGDTIDIRGTRIRLHAIDAPESAQYCSVGEKRAPCGKLSGIALKQLIDGQTVSCEPRDKDRYGRVVAVCHAGGKDLNAAMVAGGWAMAYRQYGTDYVAQEEAARAAKRGIWQTEFQPPWEWRAEQRAKAEATQKAGCNIKGNISTRTGERIYHVPGGQYYDRTRVSTSAGERWFCSEAEARAAGWRRSKR